MAKRVMNMYGAKRLLFISSLAALAAALILSTGGSCAQALHNPEMLYRRTAGVSLSNPTTDPADFEQHLQIPILLYHEVGEPFSQWEELFVRTADFEKHMKHLRDEGYSCISMKQLAAHWRQDHPLPSRPIVITFDDGYRGNYTNAYPILKELDMTATIYVVEAALGKDNFLTEEMLLCMNRAGFEVGHHSASHRNLTGLHREDLKEEISRSRTRLQKQMQVPITTFAYPAGNYDDAVLEQVQDAGFLSAVTNRPGLASYHQGLLELDRISIYRRHGLESFKQLLQSHLDK